MQIKNAADAFGPLVSLHNHVKAVADNVPSDWPIGYVALLGVLAQIEEIQKAIQLGILAEQEPK